MKILVYNLKHRGVIFFLVLILTCQSACTKFVQISPPTTSITGTTVYSNNTSAAAAMTGVYSSLATNSSSFTDGSKSISILMGLAADELRNYVPTNMEYVQFYSNTLSSFTGTNSNYYFWTELYGRLYDVNAVIAGVESSAALSTSIKNQIIGEAEFMRAFFLFYAVNLYGDVPIVTTTNYLTNNVIARSPVGDVYQQIISDLKDAQNKLSINFLDANGNVTAERVRPNNGAATALLARVYLYTGAYDSAETEATAVINDVTNYNLDSLSQIFLMNSSEAIWQLQPQSGTGYNTYDALNFVLTSAPGTNGENIAINSYLKNAFEPGDSRFFQWVGAYTADSITYYYYPYKYKVWQYGSAITEYKMVLRLAEQYLIRAESRAQQGNLVGANSALSDLNIIRNRADLPGYSGPTDQASMLEAILHENKIEFFAEWGHRWFDLKRTGAIDSVMGNPGNVCASKGGTWNDDWELLPIALQELKIDANLSQNQGY